MVRQTRNTKRTKMASHTSQNTSAGRWGSADRYAKTPRPGTIGEYRWARDVVGDWQLLKPRTQDGDPSDGNLHAIVGWLSTNPAYTTQYAGFAWVPVGGPVRLVRAKTLREAGLLIVGACMLGNPDIIPTGVQPND